MKQFTDTLFKGQWSEARGLAAHMMEQQPDDPATAIDAVVEGLHQALDQFLARPVESFCQDMDLELPEALAQRIQDEIVPRLARTHEWIERLNAVTEERLGREMLAQAVKGDLKEAARIGCELLERSADEAHLKAHCRMLAAALVELYTNRDRARKIIDLISHAGGKGAQAGPIIDEMYTAMALAHQQTALQSNNQASVRQQIEAVLSLRPALPGPNEVGEPTSEQVETFRRELNAILCAGFHHRRSADFIDALMILHEYCPVDPLPDFKRNIAGAEERMFNRLGPMARLTSVRALASLGEGLVLVKAVLQLAEADRKGTRTEVLGAVMGGLRHEDFFAFLKTRLAKARTEREEEHVVDALGRIGGSHSVDLLLARLDKAVRKIHDPAFERRAHGVMRALGRIGRARGLEVKQRLKIIDHVIESIGRTQDRHLAFHAANALFSVRLQELRPDQRGWAAARTVEALWAKPPGIAVALGYGLTDWRAPMVVTLKRLGREVLPVVIETARNFASQLSGAMDSLSGVLAEIGDASAVPLLEVMARTVLLFGEDEVKNPLLDEKVMDAVSGQYADLNRDDLVHSILSALKEIGGEEGLAVILHVADEVQSGQLSAPGGQTAALLVDVRIKQGSMAVSRTSMKEIPVDKKALKKALSEAKGGLFSKTPTRVAAIARLGTMKAMEAVPLLVKLLGEKELIYSSAAYTALSQYFRPLPIDADFSEILDAMLADPARLKGAFLERFLEFIRRELPKRPPYDRLIDRQIEAAVEDPQLAHCLRGAAVAPDITKSAGEDHATESGGEGPMASGDSTRTAMDQRREYMLARKAWVDGGKIGQPPSPPSS